MLQLDALIVGAGPTGMTAAIELRRAGLRVRIIDKSDHTAEHSQALVVQARTLEQFQRYGVADEAVQRGRPLTGAHLWSDGKEIVSVASDNIPSRYSYVLFLPQNETEDILNHTMQSLDVSAERRTELLSFTQADDSVIAQLRLPDGTTEQVETRWLLGCDGAHSTVRNLASIPFEGGGVGLSFFLGDLELEGPDVPGDQLMIHLHHGDVVFMGRLSDKLVRLIVADHTVQDDGMRKDVSIQDFQDAVDRSGVRVRILSSAWKTPFRVNDRQAQEYRRGNIFLAGDASHIHSPVGGQGMNTGIQDAANLAWKLAAVARGSDASLLDSYGVERGKVGQALLRMTERTLKMATTTNPLLERVRDTLLPILSKLHPLQRAAIGFISETAIEYRSSPVVADRGGDGSLRAGDRLPDLPLENSPVGSSLLEHWTDPHHLLLLFNADDAAAGSLSAHLPGIPAIRLNSSQLTREGRLLLGTEPKLVILRPDGYVGFRGPLDRPELWTAYAKQDTLV